MRKYRKFSEGGTAALDELASGREKGSFDEDTYARAKKFLERGGSDAPKAAAPAKPKPKASAPAPAPKAASAEIPKGGETAPASTGEDTSGPSNMDRIFMGLGAGAGIAGAAKLARLSRAEKAAEAAKETAKAAAAKFSSPQTAKQVTTETGRRFSPKAEMEAAESTMRGAVGRKQLQAKRAEAGRTAKARAETMERNKPALQATPKKASPRDRTREDREPDYELRAKGGRIGYASGGSVRGGGCESRGKTKGRFV